MVDTYQILVKGHLDDHWSDRLEGFAVQRQANGTTALIGHVVDQAALHGVIIRVRDLGLTLLSVKQVAQVNGGRGQGSPIKDVIGSEGEDHGKSR